MVRLNFMLVSDLQRLIPFLELSLLRNLFWITIINCISPSLVLKEQDYLYFIIVIGNIQKMQVVRFESNELIILRESISYRDWISMRGSCRTRGAEMFGLFCLAINTHIITKLMQIYRLTWFLTGLSLLAVIY